MERLFTAPLLLLILYTSLLPTVNTQYSAEELDKYAESMKESKKLNDFINHAINTQDKKVRPNAGGPPVVVQVEFKVVSFGEIKEAEMTYSMDIFFRQWWYDPRFAHNFSKPFTMAADATQMIWTPDTYFWNVKSAKYHRVTRENMRVMMNPDGKIYFSTRITISAQCDMDLRLYPMDIQYCPLVIESYAHTRADVDYKWKGKVEIVSEEMAQFEFMGSNTTTKEQANSKGSFASLTAEFKFKRRVSFFITATYMPAMVLVILSWCTFWIHRNAVPARVTLSITTILTTILLTGTVNASMPKVSYSKAIDYFLMTSLGFIFMSLLEYVLVLNTHPNIRKEKEDSELAQEEQPLTGESGKDQTPDTIVTMMDKTTNGRQSCQSTADRIKTCLTPKPIKPKNPKEKGLPYLDVHWIDRTARVLFPICYFSFALGYWIYYINHPLTDFQLF